MKTCFKYYILYYFVNEEGITGVGRKLKILDDELSCIEDIEEIENEIKKDKDYDQVLILNWKGLK